VRSGAAGPATDLRLPCKLTKDYRPASGFVNPQGADTKPCLLKKKKVLNLSAPPSRRPLFL